jgi:hypothetical protein
LKIFGFWREYSQSVVDIELEWDNFGHDTRTAFALTRWKMSKLKNASKNNQKEHLVHDKCRKLSKLGLPQYGDISILLIRDQKSRKQKCT